MNEQEQAPQSQKPYNLDPNVEASIAYIPLVGVAVYFMEKEDRYVRFHALQATLFWMAVVGVQIVLSLIPLIGVLLAAFIPLAAVLVWFFMMWKAYNKVEFELPVIGKIAKQHVYR